MEGFIDLHTHSTASDGTFSPKELVEYAIRKDLKALALTDHDTTDGLEEAIKAAEGTTLELIPGIELSTTWWGRDVHIVGLDLEWKNPDFQKRLLEFQDSRDLRNEKMIKLMQEQGLKITKEEMMEEFPDSVWTRAHFGRFLMERGYVRSVNEAFERYLGDRGPCYVPREKITPFQAVELIRRGRGIPVFAHPVLCRFSLENLEKLATDLKAAGLEGIEAMYSTYEKRDERRIRALAEKLDLKISGGSDFHGANKPHIDLGTGMGNLQIPYSVWENLKK